MKIAEYRKELKQTLEILFGEEAAPLCDILLAHYMETDQSGLLLQNDKDIDPSVAAAVADAVDELGMGVPVQYVIGSCYFYGRRIYTGRGCFIPRSDTETLVEAAIKLLPEKGSFCDICTGSGCIPAVIAENRPDIKGFALDISPRALEYTHKNLDGFENIIIKRFDAVDEDDYNLLREQNGAGFDLVTCNPPYIRRDDIDHLSQQVQYEPLNALDGGDDGLDYYRAVSRLSKIILKENGFILYEVGYDQSADVAEILEDEGYETAVIKDLSGIERVVLGRLIN